MIGLNKFFILISLSLGIFKLINAKFAETLTDEVKEIRRKDRFTEAIAVKIGQQIAKNHNMRMAGIGGGSLKGETWLISLYFNSDGELLTKEAARKLIVELTEEFLARANSNEEIRPYLRDFSLSENNLNFVVLSFTKDNKEVLYPYIGLVAQNEGVIRYMTKNSSDKYQQFPLKIYLIN